MKLHRLFLHTGISLLLLSSLFAVTGNTALAEHTSNKTDAALKETPDVIDRATVNLYCRLKAGKKTISTSGSGVMIDERGVILTNAHVAQYFLLQGEEGRVTGKCSVRTGSPAKETYTASLLYFPEVWLTENISEISNKVPRGTGENDFALLYITGAKKGVLPQKFSTLTPDALNNTVEDTTVTVAGYPTEKLDFKGVQRKLKLVAASSSVTGTRGFTQNASVDLLTLAPSRAGSLGVSGGPVVDADNDVVGIVATKSTGDRTLRAITLPYIDRTLQMDTGLSLGALILGDLTIRSAITRSNISSDLIGTLANTLRKKK